MKLKIIHLSLALVLVAMPLALGGAASVVQSAAEYRFGAVDQLFRNVNVGPDIDHVEANTEFSGNYNWHFFIDNGNGETVYEPTISVDSSLDPSFFPNVSEFPATWSLPSIEPYDLWILMDVHSSYPVTFTLGYDCSRTVEPLEIPPGGGIQTVTIKVEPIDLRYTSPFMRIEISGSVIEDSNTQPEGANPTIHPGGIFWEFKGQRRQYQFSVQLQVTNSGGGSLVHKPPVGVFLESDEIMYEVPGITSATTIHDEILRGNITYSVAAGGRWSHNIYNPYSVDFEATAEYMVVEYDLTIASSEGGSVTTPGEGDFTHEEGTVVDLEAKPDEGYQFVEWTGDVDTVADVEAASTTITMDDDYSVTAIFEEIPAVPTGCFVATAAYGTAMADAIQILREFRDQYLLANPLGQALIDTYYTVSPPIADFITDHPSLKPIVRAGLMPIVAMCRIVLDMVPQFSGNDA